MSNQPLGEQKVMEFFPNLKEVLGFFVLFCFAFCLWFFSFCLFGLGFGFGFAESCG